MVYKLLFTSNLRRKTSPEHLQSELCRLDNYTGGQYKKTGWPISNGTNEGMGVARSRSRQECTIRYSEHQLRPEDLLHFVELDEFAEDWERLGLDVESDLLALQLAIMSNPSGPPVIEGTGGVRKLRFAPANWKCGKSGAVRVCYAYFEKHWTVLLIVAYEKSESDNLTRDQKSGIKKYLARVEKWLDQGNGS